jgi:hypothetical protein
MKRRYGVYEKKEGRHVGQPQHKKVPNHTKENDLGTEKKGEVRCIREAMGQACVGADPCVCSKMKRRYGVYEKKEGRHVGQPQHKKVPNHTKENDLGTEKKGEVLYTRGDGVGPV